MKIVLVGSRTGIPARPPGRGSRARSLAYNLSNPPPRPADVMTPMLAAIALVLAAYVLGSVSFAVVVSRAYGLPDPHEYGSGNPGATNVLRSGNKLAAGLTLLLDALKGFVPVLLVQSESLLDQFETGW